MWQKNYTNSEEPNLGHFRTTDNFFQVKRSFGEIGLNIHTYMTSQLIISISKLTIFKISTGYWERIRYERMT